MRNAHVVVLALLAKRFLEGDNIESQASDNLSKKPVDPWPIALHLVARSAKALVGYWVLALSLTILTALFAAVHYYEAFYTAFALNPSQVGVNKGDVLLRMTPYALSVFALAVFGWSLVAFAIFLSRAFEDRDGKPGSEGKKAYTLRYVAAMAIIALPIILVVVGGTFLTTEMSSAGKRDARTVITSTDDVVFNGGSVSYSLGNPMSVTAVYWVGPESSFLTKKNSRVGSDGRRYALTRILGATEDNTYLFSLFDCRVYREPSIDLSVVSGLTSYSVGPARSFKNVCNTDIKP